MSHFWNTIIGIDQFFTQEPIEGGEPTEKTIIKIAYDQNYLCFYDSNPRELNLLK